MSPSTGLEPDVTPLRTATLRRLEQLAGTLSRRGMDASLVDPDGRVPRLQVAHPVTKGTAEDVYVSRCRDGNWWFCWSWAERIAADGDLDCAAATIERALTPAASG
jgi:hypothetical protein